MMPHTPHPDRKPTRLINANDGGSQPHHPNHLGVAGPWDTLRKGLLICALCMMGLVGLAFVPMKERLSYYLQAVDDDAIAKVVVDNSPRIDIVLKGITNAEGVIRLAAFNQQQGFPADAKAAYRLMMVPAKQGKVSVSLSDVPTGKFAIVVYHDQNNNNKLDQNFLGMPTEQYGVSNNARNRLSAPKFKEAVFDHKDAVTTIEIDLK